MLLRMPAADFAARLRDGRTSVRERVETSLLRAEAVQRELNAFITIAGDSARTRAAALDARLRRGEVPGPLFGVPVVVKDNICTEGVRTTAASLSLDGFTPPYSASVVERLEAAGAVVVAKANLDEFGMGGSNENSAYGAARNPWDPARVPGGSSGGAAAAVAAGVAPLALGTDTGGSVRQPAAFCGVIGLKPTYGRLSRYGVVAFASSLDQVGVLARSAGDAALALDTIGGRDPRDATSVDAPADFGSGLDRSIAGLRIGLVRELAGEGNGPEVLAALERTRETLERLGAELGEVSLPHARYGVPTYYLVATAEASSNLARFDGMIYSGRRGEDALGQTEVMMRSRGQTLGAEVRRRVLMGTYALSAGYFDAYYGKALKVRRLIADDFTRAFTAFDLLLAPTAPSAAYRLGERIDDPLAMYLGDVATCLANLAGIPAVSVPAGVSDAGLPVGVQLFAPALADADLLTVAAALERDAGAAFAPLAPAWRS